VRPVEASAIVSWTGVPTMRLGPGRIFGCFGRYGLSGLQRRPLVSQFLAPKRFDGPFVAIKSTGEHPPRLRQPIGRPASVLVEHQNVATWRAAWIVPTSSAVTCL